MAFAAFERTWHCVEERDCESANEDYLVDEGDNECRDERDWQCAEVACYYCGYGNENEVENDDDDDGFVDFWGADGTPFLALLEEVEDNLLRVAAGGDTAVLPLVEEVLLVEADSVLLISALLLTWL